MIIGNGLIAKSFSVNNNYSHEDLIIFASGVSNSAETRIEEFQREFEMIKKYLNVQLNRKIIYFSTGSVYSKVSSDYVLHKKRMEHLISSSTDNYLILRLANVIGNSSNNTMIPFFIKKIMNNEELTIQNGVTRQFIYEKDIVDITYDFIFKKHHGIVNIASEFSFNIESVVRIIANKLKKKVKIQYSEGSENYSIPLDLSETILNKYDLNLENYIEISLDKMLDI